jgi:hypothetical protein
MPPQTSSSQLEPYFRIKRAGCDIAVDSTARGDAGAQHRICLTRDGLAVSCAHVPRDSRFTNLKMEQRIRLGLVPFGTKVYVAVDCLALAAESLFA